MFLLLEPQKPVQHVSSATARAECLRTCSRHVCTFFALPKNSLLVDTISVYERELPKPKLCETWDPCLPWPLEAIVPCGPIVVIANEAHKSSVVATDTFEQAGAGDMLARIEKCGGVLGAWSALCDELHARYNSSKRGMAACAALFFDSAEAARKKMLGVSAPHARKPKAASRRKPAAKTTASQAFVSVSSSTAAVGTNSRIFTQNKTSDKKGSSNARSKTLNKTTRKKRVLDLNSVGDNDDEDVAAASAAAVGFDDADDADEDDVNDDENMSLPTAATSLDEDAVSSEKSSTDDCSSDECESSCSRESEEKCEEDADVNTEEAECAEDEDGFDEDEM